MKTTLMVMVAAGLLAGCMGGGSDSPLTESEIAALEPTSTMPTGTARYEGSATYIDEYTYDDGFLRYDGRVSETADLNLLANFDANTVDATLSNVQIAAENRYLNGGTSTLVANMDGQLTGSGVITDNSFGVWTEGDLTIDSLVLNGDSVDSVDNLDVGDTFAEELYLEADFVGENAEGIYGYWSEDYDDGEYSGMESWMIVGAKQ